MDSRPHPSQRKVFPPQLLPEDVDDSESLKSALRFRSPEPEEDSAEAGGDWLDLPVESEGLARIATAENLLPGTRYRFRLVFRPRLSKKYRRGWVDWTAVPLSDWFRTDGTEEIRVSSCSCLMCVFHGWCVSFMVDTCLSWLVCVFHGWCVCLGSVPVAGATSGFGGSHICCEVTFAFCGVPGQILCRRSPRCRRCPLTARPMSSWTG